MLEDPLVVRFRRFEAIACAHLGFGGQQTNVMTLRLNHIAIFIYDRI